MGLFPGEVRRDGDSVKANIRGAGCALMSGTPGMSMVPRLGLLITQSNPDPRARAPLDSGTEYLPGSKGRSILGPRDRASLSQG